MWLYLPITTLLLCSLHGAANSEASPTNVCGQTGFDPMGKRSFNHRIVGGTLAKVNSIPWIVSIRLGFSRKNHICGGTIIDVGDPKQSDIILTAAHCVFNEFEPDSIEIVAGEHDLKAKDQAEQLVEYEDFVIHPSYNHTSKENDIAVVKLKTPFKFGQGVQAACLPAAGEKLADGAQGLVAGWGRLREDDGLPPSQTLQQLVVPTVNSEKCLQLYKDVETPKFANDKTMLCAGFTEGGKDSCQGDSGGPLFFKNSKGSYVLQGVVSFGKGCARQGKAGVYARVSTYIDWIHQNIKKMSSVAKQG